MNTIHIANHMNTPLVTVLYPVFNDPPAYIKLSMESILAQDYSNLEIIVVDDSTKPESIQAVNHFCYDSRVKILRQSNSLGLPGALNLGLAVATGEYIARADADDIQHANRISSQVAFLETHRSVGILGSNVNYIDSEGRTLRVRNYPESNQRINRHLHIRNPICHSVVMVRTEVFKQIGNYNTNYKRAEDYELWMRASAHKIEMHTLQTVLMDYRMATGFKRDSLNWKMNLKLKRKYFSSEYFLESIAGIASVYFYTFSPASFQNFIYKKLA
jgi:glycosyltransferase EpsE